MEKIHKSKLYRIKKPYRGNNIEKIIDSLAIIVKCLPAAVTSIDGHRFVSCILVGMMFILVGFIFWVGRK